jgi:drug/metabolite transporter (DMT)-like permease
MQNILGQLFALFTALCWAQNSVVYSFAGKRVSSRTVTHIRLWVALPVMIIVHTVFTGTLIPRGLEPSSYIYLGASGLMGFCLADLFIFRAFVDLGPRETLVVLTLSPIFAALISWGALGELLGPVQILGICGTIGGVSWVVLSESRGAEKKGRDSRLGVVFALAGALSQAVGMVLAKQGLAEGTHPVSANLLRMTAGFAGLVIFAAMKRNLVKDFKKMRDGRAFLLISAGALVGPVLGIILTMYALTLAPVGIVTTIMQTSPIFLLPVDRFVFKKRIPWGALGGTVLAIGGAMLLFLF